jgi:hypothetical protein
VITAIGEPALLRIGFGERFPGIRLDKRLIVGDELVQYIIRDIGLRCLNAIAYPACAGVVITTMEETR